jgi:hypothetical protein
MPTRCRQTRSTTSEAASQTLRVTARFCRWLCARTLTIKRSTIVSAALCLLSRPQKPPRRRQRLALRRIPILRLPTRIVIIMNCRIFFQDRDKLIPTYQDIVSIDRLSSGLISGASGPGLKVSRSSCTPEACQRKCSRRPRRQHFAEGGWDCRPIG